MIKKSGGIMLVAGTCIGSGMIALPMVLAKVGIIPAIVLMLSIWLLMYYTSLLNLELNLEAGKGLSLGALGRLFSGKGAEFLGYFTLKLLMYSLLAVFIYGGASIIQEWMEVTFHKGFSFAAIASFVSFIGGLILLFPFIWLDYFNRLLFVSLIGIVTILVIGLGISLKWDDLPWFSSQDQSLAVWAELIPVVFTSFGFQVIFHTLVNNYQKNAKVLKKVFFLGSLIPALIYIVWVCTILGAIFHENLSFYQQMANGKAEVGELIQALSEIAKGQSVQLLIWLISLLAIMTSLIGVGLGLFDALKGSLDFKIKKPLLREVTAAILTIVPAYLAVLFIPNAFIAVLGFAGLLLAIIAILLPIYLFWKSKHKGLFYPELKIKGFVVAAFMGGLLVILSELYTIFSK